MEQDQSQSKVETQYCLKKKKNKTLFQPALMYSHGIINTENYYTF